MTEVEEEGDEDDDDEEDGVSRGKTEATAIPVRRVLQRRPSKRGEVDSVNQASESPNCHKINTLILREHTTWHK